MSVLVFAENWDGKFKKLTYELVSYANELAKQIGILEDEIDAMYYECLIKLGEQTPNNSRCTLANLLFVLYLERMSDHAAYIGESIIYSLTSEYITLR